jgi:uncharacterized Zn finger protein
VAALLTCIRSTEEVEELPSIEDMLADLDRDQLQALLLKLVEHQPDLADVIQKQLSPAQTEAAKSHPREQPNSKTVRRQVHGILHSLDYMRSSEAYWHVGGIVHSVMGVLEQARAFMEAGDGRGALTVLEAATDEYVDGWTDLDDSDGEIGDSFYELGPLWAEALLLADLTPSEREEWAVQLDAWEAALSDYGVDGAFTTAYAAAIQGWDSPFLRRAMNEEEVDIHEWNEEDPWHSDLAEVRLNILERQGRTQEYLNLAKVEGQTKRCITMLVQLGRVQEAVDYGMKYMELADEAMALAKALHERGEIESALDIAEYGLKLDGEHNELTRWLRDAAASAGKSEMALNAAIAAVCEKPDLVDYQRVQDLAGERWPELRDGLLEHLRELETWPSEPRVRIFLHEGLIDDAIAGLGSYVGYSLLEDVVDAAVSERPDWAISICRREAEEIMDAAKSSIYHHAAKWLEKARAAYLSADREAEWQEYLDGLLEEHRRKRKLVPMLKALQ